MPIPYTQRRKFRLKLIEQLPPALRGKIALRNIETFASFPAQARQSLEIAVLAGLTQIPRAIRLLKDNPYLSAEELLACVEPRRNTDRADAAQTPPACASRPRQL